MMQAPGSGMYAQMRLGAQRQRGGSPFMPQGGIDPGFQADPNILNALKQHRRRPLDPGFGGQGLGEMVDMNIRNAITQRTAAQPGYGTMTPETSLPTTHAAWANIANAMGRQYPQGQPAVPARPGYGQVVESDTETPVAGMPTGGIDETGQPTPIGADQVVMKYDYTDPANPKPIYYGSEDARNAAIQGLLRVLHGYGLNSARYRDAYRAALGVVGDEDLITPDVMMAMPWTGPEKKQPTHGHQLP
jgi:hypothetical protein